MITLAAYDPRWPAQFAAEARRIRQALGGDACRIDHVGSTAVPGLAAKPVIDIQVSMRTLTPAGCHTPAMQLLGYHHLNLGDFDLVYPYYRRPADWPHTHHVHLCQAGGTQERRHLAFRDFLRRHADAAASYLALKQRLASLHDEGSAESREAYSLAKSDFVEAAIALAFREGLPLDGPSDA